MARDNGASGCGCLLLVVGAVVLLSGGSVLHAIGAMLVSWFGFFAFIAVTVGMMLGIVKAISGGE